MLLWSSLPSCCLRTVVVVYFDCLESKYSTTRSNDWRLFSMDYFVGYRETIWSEMIWYDLFTLNERLKYDFLVVQSRLPPIFGCLMRRKYLWISIPITGIIVLWHLRIYRFNVRFALWTTVNVWTGKTTPKLRIETNSTWIVLDEEWAMTSSSKIIPPTEHSNCNHKLNVAHNSRDSSKTCTAFRSSSRNLLLSLSISTE